MIGTTVSHCRIVEKLGQGGMVLAFDTTNFDSYAAAKTPSRLLGRGHAKSARPLRVLGLGLLVTEDEGIPLLTFTYPGNENDVTAFGRFLQALDRRRSSLDLPLEATIAADGGNISKEILRRLEEVPRYYVLRLPASHGHVAAGSVQRAAHAGGLSGGEGQGSHASVLLSPNFLPFWKEFFTAETQSTQRLKTQKPLISRMGPSGHGLLLSRRDGAARRSSELESRKQAPPMRSDQRLHPSTGVCFRDSSPDDSKSPCPRRQSYFLCDLCVSAVCFLLGCGR